MIKSFLCENVLNLRITKKVKKSEFSLLEFYKVTCKDIG